MSGVQWLNLTAKPANERILSEFQLYSGHLDQGEVMLVMGEATNLILDVFADDGQERLTRPAHTIVLDSYEDSPFWPMSIEDYVGFYTEFQNIPDAQRKERSEYVLTCFGLDKIRKEQVGQLEDVRDFQGRQRTIIIASHLVLFPGLLVFQNPFEWMEPANALNALKLMNALKLYAMHAQCVVILSVPKPHQDILTLADKLMIFAYGRRLVYFGPVDQVAQHFASLGHEEEGTPLANFLSALIEVDFSGPTRFMQTNSLVDSLARSWKDLQVNRSNVPVTQVQRTEAPVLVPLHKQFRLLFWRFKHILIHDRANLVAVFIQSTLIFLIVSFLFLHKPLDTRGLALRTSLFFLLAINNTFAVSLPAALFYCSQYRASLYESRRLGLYKSWLIPLAKLALIAPFRMLLSQLILIPLYYITDLRHDNFTHLLIFISLFLLNTLVSGIVGVLVTTVSPTLDFTQILIVLTVDVFIIFGGLGNPTSKPSWVIRWLQYLSPIFYTFRGLLRNELENQSNIDTAAYLSTIEIDGISLIWSAFSLLLLATGYLSILMIATVALRPRLDLLVLSVTSLVIAFVTCPALWLKHRNRP